MPSWPRSRARRPGAHLCPHRCGRMPSHRSRGRGAMPTTSPPAPERRAAAAGRCTPRRSRGTLKDGRRRPDTLLKPRGGQTLDNSARQSLGCSGFNFQILLVPRGLGEGLPRAEEYLACVKRTPFTDQATPLRLTSAGSNLRLLTTGEKAKTFSQTFSHPSLRAHETQGGATSCANQPRSFPS